MNPEEITEAIATLEARCSQRVSQLQMADPQLQALLGELKAYKSMVSVPEEVPVPE